MKKYYPRIIDELLKRKLRTSGAVLLKCTKWCGKSNSTRQIAKSIIYMQELLTGEHNIALAKALPKIFLISSNLLFAIIYSFFANIEKNEVLRYFISYFITIFVKFMRN